MNVALGRADNPTAVGLLFCRRHRTKPLNFSTHFARTGSIGIGHTAGVNVAAIRLKHNATDAIVIDQRMQALRLIAANLMEIHPVKLGLGSLQSQLMFAGLGLRQIKRPWLKHTTRLTGFGLQFIIQIHRIVLNAADICAVMQPVNVGGRMPS